MPSALSRNAPSVTSAAALMDLMRLNEKAIQERKRLLALDPGDEARVKALAPIVRRHSPENAALFFEHLRKSHATEALFADAKLLETAQRMKREHLEAMVGGVYDKAYAEQRLALSLIYSEAGVDVHIFAAAYHDLLNRINAQVRTAARETHLEPAAAVDSLQKVAFFDLGLFMEALVTLRQAAMRQVSEDASAYARSLIEASLDPLVTISADGKITDVNEATVGVTGVPREKLIGTDFSTYFTEPAKAQEGYQQVFKTGFVKDYPLTIRSRSGRPVDVLYNATVYKDARGKVLGVFAAARDVTASKQASAYARSLIEASLDPLVTISPDGKVTDVNQATIEVTGLPREKLVGTDFSQYFTEPAKAQAGYQQVFKSGFVKDYPLTIRSRSGRPVDVLYNASVYKDQAGNVLGVFAAARDVTASKQASAYARSLIEASLDPLVTISADGKVTDVNQATIEVTGLPREKLVGTDFSQYFTEPAKAQEGYQQVFKTGFVKDYPLTIRSASGRLVDVLYNATVYRDLSGNVLGVFAAARDVTAQKKAEAEVATQRARELDRLAELERFQRLTVGRELKMIELKKEIEELRGRGAGAS